MAMITINKNPSRTELRWFGGLFLLFFAIVGGILWWRFGLDRVATVLWIAAAAVTVVYYAAPPVQRLLYLGWMYAAYPIGWTVSHVLLALIYYLVFTPIGLIMRLAGRDPMSRRFDREAPTYWIEREATPEASRYFRQF